jgi:predicted nuclease of predicted toxin-antitoxin system
MRFVVDMQLPPRLAAWLRLQGAEAWHAVELGLGAASDHRLATEALNRGAAIISKDSDFLKLRPMRDTVGPVVILIRTGNCSTSALMMFWQDNWPAVQAAMARGESLIALERNGL